MNIFQCVLLIAGCGLTILVSGCEKPVKSSRFEAMRNLVIQGDYDQAISSLEQYVSKSPTGSHASRAGLFLFKANFAKGNFDEAKKWCDWTIANHANSLEAKKCKFKIGLILLVQEKPQQALKQFQSVAASNDNPLRPEATTLVDHLKAKQGANDQDPSDGVDPE